MRVVLDCRSVFAGMGGIGRATAALARELPAALPHAEVHLLLGARRPREPLTRAPNAREHDVGAAMIDPAFEQVRLPALLDELEADVYHGTCFATPIATAVRRVATVHDVVFRRHPELVDPSLRRYLDRWTRVSCEVADAVVTVSEFSKRELCALYGVNPATVAVVPNAVDERFFETERRPAPGAPYVLYAGALEEKKNVPALLRGFAALRRRAPELPHVLVLAGGGGGAPFDVETAIAAEPELAGRVHVLGHVPDERLLALYASADAFCYLSKYEGFGLPPLEAMAARVPTVVAERSCLPEVVGKGALVVEPGDPSAVADALRKALTDEPLRAQLTERGLERARSFSWGRSARVLARLYQGPSRSGRAA